MGFIGHNAFFLMIGWLFGWGFLDIFIFRLNESSSSLIHICGMIVLLASMLLEEYFEKIEKERLRHIPKDYWKIYNR